jgi:hypothetical protein
LSRARAAGTRRYQYNEPFRPHHPAGTLEGIVLTALQIQSAEVMKAIGR